MAILSGSDCPNNDRRILEGEAAFLRVLLAAPNGIAALAEATEPAFRHRPYPDGGKWRGSIPKRLSGRGIIGKLVASDCRFESHNSPRTARRRGIAGVWKLIDPDAGRKRLQQLEAVLERRPGKPRGHSSIFDILDELGLND